MAKKKMLKNNLGIHESSLSIVLWGIFFCYAVCMALIFQNVIVPNMPSILGEGKLLANDAVYFDQVAWSMAAEIKLHGWGTWQLFPASGAAGNVAILAGLYAIFGHDPSLMIPINSCLHAIGGVLIFWLAKELATNEKVALYSGIIAGTLFVVFPSALSWYGQLHKDSFAIVGTLMFLLIWIKISKNPKDIAIWSWVLLGSGLSTFLIGIVRPYGLTILLVVSLGALLLVTFNGFAKSVERCIFRRFILGSTVVAILFSGVILTDGDAKQLDMGSNTTYQLPQTDQHTQADQLNQADWEWQYSKWIPNSVEKYVASAAKVRMHYIYWDQIEKAGSTMDPDIAPENIIDVVMYLPRSLQIATFAPFPSSWFTEKSVIRLLASVEMMVYYLCLIGLFFLLRYNRTPEVLLTIYFSAAFLVILGFTIVNLGTLYRLRYAYFCIVLMLGVLGWIIFLERNSLIDKFINYLRRGNNSYTKNPLLGPDNDSGQKRKQVVGSGIYVMALTLVSFLGFFYRDILMAHVFGLGGELDNFFIALLVPMTMVTILCMPLGAAFTPLFLRATENISHKNIQAMITYLSLVIVTVLFVVCSITYLFIPSLLPYIIRGNAVDNVEQIYSLLLIALPILFFSGSVILGNTILNALGKVVTTGVAQLVVPLVAILAVVMYGNEYGVIVAMLGMVVGQLVNLIILQIKLKELGYSLIPRFNYRRHYYVGSLSYQYFPLVASAFFVSIAVLVNSLLAMSLPEGSVSIYTLGNKVVLLITGLLGASISTVVLPYFSALVAKNNMVTARRELSVFLLVITFISVPFSVAFFVWAEEIVTLIFSGGDFEPNALGSVARVMQYAVVQIPFFACNILLLKFATATKHVKLILLIAILGLVINIGASLFFMKFMGVAGIALGATLSMVIATVFFVLILVRYQHIALLDTVILFINWILFITLLISVHFDSISGVILTIFSYIILVNSYRKSLADSISHHVLKLNR